MRFNAPDLSAKAEEALAPGRKLFLVLSVDLLRDRIDVRQASILAAGEHELVLGQTVPRIEHERIGSGIEAAFFLPTPVTPLSVTYTRPWGFAAKIVDVIEWQGPDGRDDAPRDTVIIAATGEDLHETSIRMRFRFPLTPESGISIRIESHPQARLLDISSGGALIGLPDRPCLAKGESFPITLLFPDGSVDANAQVRWLAVEPNGTECLAGLKFEGLTIPDMRYLDRVMSRLGVWRSEEEEEGEADLPAQAPEPAAAPSPEPAAAASEPAPVPTPEPAPEPAPQPAVPDDPSGKNS